MLDKIFSEDEKLKYLIGFNISRTIDIERAISYFICLFYSNHDSKLEENIYDLISEFTFNKKISLFLKITSANQVKFNCSEKLKESLKIARIIRNHLAHDSFSFNQEESKYTFVNIKGNLTKYANEEIEDHWKVCKYIYEEVIKLSSKI